MTAYWVGLIEIEDSERYEEYASRFDLEDLERCGGEIVVLSDEPDVLEGEWPDGRLVILRFPTRADLDRWYDGESYRRVRPIRLEATRSRAAVHPGFEPPP
jgi:uncharacterized protein (DUF1330 family)